MTLKLSIFFNLKVEKKKNYTLNENITGGDGLVVPSWLALCQIAQGSGFESQRGHLFFGISPWGEISQVGFF
jgi:hypothetical protein